MARSQDNTMPLDANDPLSLLRGHNGHPEAPWLSRRTDSTPSGSREQTDRRTGGPLVVGEMVNL